MSIYTVSVQEIHKYDVSVVGDTKEKATQTCFDIILTANEMIDEIVDNFTDRWHPEISGFQIVQRYGGNLKCLQVKENTNEEKT